MILKAKYEGDLGGVGGKLGQIFYVCVYVWNFQKGQIFESELRFYVDSCASWPCASV